jgi:hypothetical protein
MYGKDKNGMGRMAKKLDVMSTPMGQAYAAAKKGPRKPMPPAGAAVPVPKTKPKSPAPVAKKMPVAKMKKNK